MNDCLISFGSNLGDRRELLAEAARRISGLSLVDGLFQTSRLYETPPIGGPGGQEPFLNAVAYFRTHSSAAEILGMLQAIELELGRQRGERWAARTVDLDVVMHGHLSAVRSPADRRGLIGGGSSLVVPHPRYTARRFILHPACDVAANLCDPRFGWTIERLTSHIDSSVASMAIVGGNPLIQHGLRERLRGRCRLDPSPGTAIDTPWVAFDWPIDQLRTDPSRHRKCSGRNNATPRLIGRINLAGPNDRWPATHQLWPGAFGWPEYRLEVDDLDWAASEILSALDSMACPLKSVTGDGHWW